MTHLVFDDLFPELKHLVGLHLDSASKFSLSLISRSNHAAFSVVSYDPKSFAYGCCSEGFLPLLQWGHSLGCPIDALHCSLLAAKAGHIDVLAWLYESDYEIAYPAISEYAATVRSTVLLSWLESKQSLYHARAAMGYAAGGHNTHLMVLLQHVALSQENMLAVMKNAIAAQHVSTVKLLLKRLSAPLNCLCAVALISGNEEIIQFLVHKGAALDDAVALSAETVTFAKAETWAKNIAWFLRNCTTPPPDDIITDISHAAVGLARTELLRFLHENYNYSCSAADFVRLALSWDISAEQKLETLRFIDDHGGHAWSATLFDLILCRGVSVALFEYLLSKGCTIRQNTLHSALLGMNSRTFNGEHQQVIRTILECGGSISLPAILTAVQIGNIRLLKFLFAQGASFARPEVIRCVLRPICQFADASSTAAKLAVLRWLVKHGAVWPDDAPYILTAGKFSSFFRSELVALGCPRKMDLSLSNRAKQAIDRRELC